MRQVIFHMPRREPGQRLVRSPAPETQPEPKPKRKRGRPRKTDAAKHAKTD